MAAAPIRIMYIFSILPVPKGMPTEHTIRTDGDEIAAVHHEANSTKWIVFSHGFISDKTGSYEERCDRAITEGYNAVRFDYRGCGESSGEFVNQTLSSKITDLKRVISYFNPDSCVVFGSSFGAKTAFHTALNAPQITAIVGRAPALYNSSMNRSRAEVEHTGRFEYTPTHIVDHRFFTDLDTHPFTDVESGLSIPVALFHGTEDESVPVTHSFQAATALSVDSLVQTYTGEGHRFSERAEARMRDQTFDWLTTYYNT